MAGNPDAFTEPDFLTDLGTPCISSEVTQFSHFLLFYGLTIQALSSTPSPEYGKVATDGQCPDSHKTMWLHSPSSSTKMKAILEQHQLYHTGTGSSQPPFSEIMLWALHRADLVKKAGGIFAPMVSHLGSFF